MSVSRKLAIGIPGALIAAFATCSTAFASEDDVPEVEFLEYLGMWEESDEEWLVFDEDAEQAAAEAELDGHKRIDPVPESEESREIDDES